MTQTDAPFYVKPSTDLALLEWLLRFSLRCNAKDMHQGALAKSSLLNGSRALLQTTIEHHQLDCAFSASGVMYASIRSKAWTKCCRSCRCCANVRCVRRC